MVKTMRNSSWWGFPIFGEKSIWNGRDRSRDTERRDVRQSILMTFEPPCSTCFLGCQKIGSYGIRPWDDFWGAGYLLGSNAHGKVGRKYDWVEGENELQYSSSKALADPKVCSIYVELCSIYGPMESFCLSQNALACILPQWPVTHMGCPRKGLFFSEAALHSWGRAWSSWQLLQAVYLPHGQHRGKYILWQGSGQPIWGPPQKPTFTLPSLCLMFPSFFSLCETPIRFQCIFIFAKSRSS